MRRSHAVIVIALLPLAGCARLDHFGRPPSMSSVGPVAAPAYESTLAQPGAAHRQPAAPDAGDRGASLFRQNARSLFSDQRATRVGDILTVRINIADRAEVDNTTSRSRASSENMGIPNALGLEAQLDKFLPKAVDPENLFAAKSGSNATGSGQTQRSERIDMTVAAIVTDVLPNGNLIIRGKQEVLVNFELRDLVISGIVRPEDISARNTIDHTQIAEARIAYGGRGQLSDVQQPRLGQQLYDIIAPF